MPRLFLAIPISQNLKLLISNFRKSQNSIPKWIPSKNLHITVIPPSYPQNIDDFIKKIAKVSKNYPAFSLHFTKIISFRYMFWARCDESKTLSKLKSELEIELNLKPEKRDFHPHITIAKFPNSQKAPNLEISIDSQETVNELVLLESNLHKPDSIYKTITKFPLTQS